MKILCTIPGKYGDLLWALPTVRAITELKENFNVEEAENNRAKVDVGIMPQYESLLPLLNAQYYIDKAFIIENWILEGSPHGDQPWEAPVPERYDKVYHLGYRHHPSRNNSLIDFIAGQQGIQLTSPIPFISVPSFIGGTEGKDLLIQELTLQRSIPTIAYAFNESLLEEKLSFLRSLTDRLQEAHIGQMMFKDVSKRPWLEAAYIISNSIAFIGCRSSNYVLACGLGKRVFVYEPNSSRSVNGPWGTTFSCPYANETEVTSVEVVKDEINKLLKEAIACV